VEAAEQMMHRIVGTTYYAPQFDPKKQPTVDEKPTSFASSPKPVAPSFADKGNSKISLQVRSEAK
jgi:hypothetical protein